MLGLTLSVCAGFCAAMASVCAKLAMASESTLQLCKFVEESRAFHQWVMFASLIPPCEQIIVVIRIGFFGLIFIFNGLMWTFFVKSLQKCSSSAEATVTNSAANLFFTAICGKVLFGESISLLWWLGMSFVMMGLVLMHQAAAEDHRPLTSDSDHQVATESDHEGSGKVDQKATSEHPHNRHQEIAKPKQQ